MRQTIIKPMSRREEIRVKAYKRLAKRYGRLSERAEGQASDIEVGRYGIYRPEDVEPVIRCPLCGGRLVHHGTMLCKCEFVDCDYVFGFDDDGMMGHSNSWERHPVVPANYEEYKKRGHVITLTREKDPEFFEILQKGIDKSFDIEEQE